MTDAGSRRAISTPDGSVGGLLCEPFRPALAAPLLICIHGSGCSHRYFDLKSNSLLDAALDREIPVLLVDRPGYGASRSSPAGPAIDHGVDAVTRLLAQVVVERKELADRPLALLGHSFGGAVALTYAADAGSERVRSVCVSGIGDVPDAGYVAAADQRAAGAAPASPAPYWLFGPGSSYDWRGVTALRAAAEPWQPGEVAEISRLWPSRWTDVTARVRCAVQVRLAEHERIWEADDRALARIARSFPNAAALDVAIAPDGGHLYEAHLRGPELVAAQLDFVMQHAGAEASIA